MVEGLNEAFLPAAFRPLCDRGATPAMMQYRGTGKRVERCQRTVLRGQQAPENRCMQGRKKRRSGERSSRQTSGTRMPRCRSELPGAPRERGWAQRSLRAQRTTPTEVAKSSPWTGRRARAKPLSSHSGARLQAGNPESIATCPGIWIPGSPPPGKGHTVFATAPPNEAHDRSRHIRACPGRVDEHPFSSPASLTRGAIFFGMKIDKGFA